jgi:hypothetical protein
MQFKPRMNTDEHGFSGAKRGSADSISGHRLVRLS